MTLVPALYALRASPLVLLLAAAGAVAPAWSADAVPPVVSAQCSSDQPRVHELEAQVDRDRTMLQDLRDQIAHLRQAGTDDAAQGADPQALLTKGLTLYKNGDGEGAAPLFRRAAQAGSPDGMIDLAMLYLNGKGVPQDPQQAVALLERASAKGSVIASENLGRMYQQAVGIWFNRDHAIHWYQVAEQQGSTIAASQIDLLRRLPLR
jgi:TPR repeat protein